MAATESLLVVQGETIPQKTISRLKISVVVCNRNLFDHSINGVTWLALEDYRETPNIQEAYQLIGEIYTAQFADGSKVTEEVVYKGHELVWYFQKGTYLRHLLPYLEWKSLLSMFRNYTTVYIHDARSETLKLFVVFCEAYQIELIIPTSPVNRLKKTIMSGYIALSQVIKLAASLISLLVLTIQRPRLLVWQGSDIINLDDYDFRYAHIYQELRRRDIKFVEFLRSSQPIPRLLKNILIRRRPVIYHDSSLLLSPFIPSILARRLKRRIDKKLPPLKDEETGLTRFYLLLVSLQFEYCFHLKHSSIFLKWVIKAIGLKACFTPAAPYRNGAVLLACKLLRVPIVGIQASNSVRFYEIEEYYPGIDVHDPSPACDIWGVWSSYYRDYLIRHSRVYNDTNTFVSGPMRPLIDSASNEHLAGAMGDQSKIKVLLISEPLTEPHEITPYVEKIIEEPSLKLSVKCRPDRTDNIIRQIKQHSDVDLLTGSLEEAYSRSDVVIGSRSTAVIEGMVAMKPIVLLNTRKWGDFFECEEGKFGVFVKGPDQVVSGIRTAAGTPPEELKRRRQHIWGDMGMNGAVTTVDTIEKVLRRR